MKIFLIITLYLFSGPADCSNVTGYSGGSVIIISKLKWDSSNSKYVCKVGQSDCTDIIRSHPKSNDVQKGRFRLYKNINDFLLVFIRKLKPKDAGKYRFGIENQNSSDLNLEVRNDCCGRQKTINTYLGENITFISNYPEEYKNQKYIYKLDYDVHITHIITSETQSQNGRFSISDDKGARVLSVNISDVREEDEGFYLCGMWVGGGSIEYYSYFTEIELQIAAQETKPQQPSPATLTTAMQSTAFIYKTSDTQCSSIVIPVCICAALLLIGGFALMFYMWKRNKTQGSCRRLGNKATSDEDNQDNLYENTEMLSKIRNQPSLQDHDKIQNSYIWKRLVRWNTDLDKQMVAELNPNSGTLTTEVDHQPRKWSPTQPETGIN